MSTRTRPTRAELAQETPLPWYPALLPLPAKVVLDVDPLVTWLALHFGIGPANCHRVIMTQEGIRQGRITVDGRDYRIPMRCWETAGSEGLTVSGPTAEDAEEGRGPQR